MDFIAFGILGHFTMNCCYSLALAGNVARLSFQVM